MRSRKKEIFKLIVFVLLIIAVIIGSSHIYSKINDIEKEVVTQSEEIIHLYYEGFGVTVDKKDIDLTEKKLIIYNGDLFIPVDSLMTATGYTQIWNDEKLEYVKTKTNEIEYRVEFYSYDELSYAIGLKVNGECRELAPVPLSYNPFLYNDVWYVPLIETSLLLGYKLEWYDTYVNLKDEYFLKILNHDTLLKIDEIYSDYKDQFFHDYRWRKEVPVEKLNKALGIKEKKKSITKVSNTKKTSSSVSNNTTNSSSTNSTANINEVSNNEINNDEVNNSETNQDNMTFLGQFKLTAYCACYSCSEGYGAKTSTGKTATEGRTIAVDPKVIPYGSKVYIEGYGYYIAEDCGGAIKNQKVDIFFNSHSKATTFGVKYANVYIVK